MWQLETSRSTDRCLNGFENKCPNKYQGFNGMNLNQILNHIFRSIWFSSIFSKVTLKKMEISRICYKMEHLQQLTCH